VKVEETSPQCTCRRCCCKSSRETLSGLRLIQCILSCIIAKLVRHKILLVASVSTWFYFHASRYDVLISASEQESQRTEQSWIFLPDVGHHDASPPRRGVWYFHSTIFNKMFLG
jgi:hypothetical protein